MTYSIVSFLQRNADSFNLVNKYLLSSYYVQVSFCVLETANKTDTSSCNFQPHIPVCRQPRSGMERDNKSQNTYIYTRMYYRSIGTAPRGLNTVKGRLAGKRSEGWPLSSPEGGQAPQRDQAAGAEGAARGPVLGCPGL